MSNNLVTSLATSDTSAYALTNIEQAFDASVEGETSHVAQTLSEFTPRLLTAQSSQRGGVLRNPRGTSAPHRHARADAPACF
jgi:hypothetical protein